MTKTFGRLGKKDYIPRTLLIASSKRENMSVGEMAEIIKSRNVPLEDKDIGLKGKEKQKRKINSMNV